jgi:hypothetical protein
MSDDAITSDRRVERCGNCRYWDRSELTEIEPNDEERSACHRHAPSPLQGELGKIGGMLGNIRWCIEGMSNTEHSDDADYNFELRDSYEVDEWPRTRADDWCGEFEQATMKVIPKEP